MRAPTGAAVLAGVVSSLALCACGAQTAGGSQADTEQLLQRAMRDARASGSVHETELVKVPGSEVAFSDDVGVGQGRQNITLGRAGTVHVRVVGRVAYVSGPETLLRTYFGFPQAAAKRIGKRWVSIPSSSRAYATVVADATLASALDEIRLKGPFAETAPSTLNGESVVGIQGAISVPGARPRSIGAMLYVTLSSKPLPVEMTYSLSDRASAKIVLDRWSEPLALKAPTHVIAQSAFAQPTDAVGSTKTAAVTSSDPSERLGAGRVPSLSPPSGFKSGTAQPPATGTWNATGTTVGSVGYSDDAAGTTLKRVWTITRACSQTCTYTLTRPFVGDGTTSVIRAKLAHEADGWIATWPLQRTTCGGTAAHPIYWDQQEIWVLRFLRDGTVAQARERALSYTPRCGYGAAVRNWRATLANR